ncbi:MAG: hypothetical protein FJ278_20245, partial [Planctomycetes bacterium]|nr:hypothetical protein [Planctomycetota bacterium]
RWDEGKWGWHAPSDDMPAGVIECYDLVYDSPAFDKLSQERGYDVRKRFENDFLRDTFAAVSAHPNHVNNYVAYLSVAAHIGRVMGEPRFVHWAFHWMKQNVYAGCFYDGMWHESPSYHYMTTSGLRSCFESVRGYSDPPGYVDPTDGTRLENLDPDKDVAFWAKVRHAPEALDFPNGCSTPVHDTWGGTRASKPRDQTVSTILPGFGHASLGRGAGPNQMQAQLHFSGGYGHHHLDNLHLTLFAKGREMLSDIGYTWTSIRWWTTSTFSHNTVTVDGKDQAGKSSDGDLLWFFPDSHGVAVVEADGQRGYGHIEKLDTYRRLLVMIPVSDADAYVVDLFRTRGGSVHDWLLHGDADEDMSAACSLPLSQKLARMDAKGVKAYELMRDVQSAQAAEGLNVTFTYVANPDKGVRVHLVGGGQTQVFLGRSPSVRRTGIGGRGDNRKVLDFWMPQLVVRRTGPAPFQSAFAAVHEPFDGKPFIESVTALPLAPPDPSAVALRVKHSD